MFKIKLFKIIKKKKKIFFQDNNNIKILLIKNII
jgi:hypothetical protein